VSNGVEAQPVVPEPVLRRLTDSEAALVEAADLFNASPLPSDDRGVARRSVRAARLDHPALRCELGARAHVRLGDHLVPVPRAPEAGQPIRLADRGADISEIEAAFTEWNGSLDDGGRVVPNVAR
jgi:hypothetical protein